MKDFMKHKTHMLISFFLFVIMSIAGAEEPTLDIDVENALQEGDGDEVAVSNLKKVELKVILDSKGQFELPSLAGIQVNPEDTEELNHWLEISAKVESSEASVPLKTEVLRKTMPDGQIALSVQILETEEVVDQKINKYVQKLRTVAEDEYTKNDTEENKIRLDFMKRHEDGVFMQSLKRYYMENRVDEFEVKFSYYNKDQNALENPMVGILSSLHVRNLGECLCEIFDK